MRRQRSQFTEGTSPQANLTSLKLLDLPFRSVKGRLFSAENMSELAAFLFELCDLSACSRPKVRAHAATIAESWQLRNNEGARCSTAHEIKLRWQCQAIATRIGVAMMCCQLRFVCPANASKHTVAATGYKDRALARKAVGSATRQKGACKLQVFAAR